MAYAQGVRPNPKLSKHLYKALQTPKSLQQDDKNFNEKTVKFWSKESFPYQSGTM